MGETYFSPTAGSICTKHALIKVAGVGFLTWLLGLDLHEVMLLLQMN